MSHPTHRGATSTSSTEALASLASSNSPGSGLGAQEWNALIGIVTAIVGNILISFALNLQRYAHIRLNRDKLRSQKSWADDSGKRSLDQLGYGTQSRIAEERAELNRNASTLDEQSLSGHEADETAPLRGSRYSSASSSSSSIREQNPLGDEDEQSKSYLRSPYWWAGILLMTVGEAGNFLAYGFAPASIVSPLGVVALISNCIIAPCLLKERFRQRDFWGVLIAVGGVVTVVLSAKTSETRFGPDDVWGAITRWEFELYLGLTAGTMFALMWASGKYGEKTILIDLGLVGLFGGYTALSTKGVASLLSGSLWRALTFPITYLLAFILVTTAIFQIRYLNRALQRFDSTQVIPTQFVIFTISVIVGSAVLYRDFESADGERVGKFVGGCALTFSGVYLITSGRGSREDEDEEEEDEVSPEEGINLVDEEAQLDTTREGGSEMVTAFAAGERPLKDGAPDSLNRPRRPSNGYGPLSRFNSMASSTSRPFTPPSAGLDSPLMDNPWLSSQERLAPRPSTLQHATTSSVPRMGGSRPSTPRLHAKHRHVSTMSERPLGKSRKSLAGLFPGPLSSPLSSSLSAVVADTLRRGIDSPTRLRHRRLGLRKSRSQKLDDDGRGHDSVPASPLKPNQANIEDRLRRPKAKTRSKSLSDTLGSFFHPQRNSSKNDVRDVEAAEENASHDGEHSDSDSS